MKALKIENMSVHYSVAPFRRLNSMRRSMPTCYVWMSQILRIFRNWEAKIYDILEWWQHGLTHRLPVYSQQEVLGMQSIGYFYGLSLDKLLNNRRCGQWIETP